MPLPGVQKGEKIAPTAPMKSYLVISMANCMATTCQYEALRYVSFPTQTLGKTAKMIPVMIWGTCLIGKTVLLPCHTTFAVITPGRLTKWSTMGMLQKSVR